VNSRLEVHNSREAISANLISQVSDLLPVMVNDTTRAATWSEC
jgi:hypothetical protein